MNSYKVIEDPKWGYLRIDPIPTVEEVEKFYLQDFYSSEYKRFNDSSLEVQKEEKDFFDVRWQRMLEVAYQYFGKTDNLSLFDIGFGFAQALLYFSKSGLSVGGVEPSPEGVQYALSEGLTDVMQAGIESFNYTSEKKYNIVTMINVLEHLRNPIDALINIKNNILSEKGMLIIDVPNEFNDLQTIANKEFDLKEWWVCPPNHINYFSTTSLSSILERSGFKVFKKENSFPLELFILMGENYVGNHTIGKEIHNKRVQFEKLMYKYGKTEKLYAFYEALATLDLGRQTTIYAFKN